MSVGELFVTVNVIAGGTTSVVDVDAVQLLISFTLPRIVVFEPVTLVVISGSALFRTPLKFPVPNAIAVVPSAKPAGKYEVLLLIEPVVR